MMATQTKEVTSQEREELAEAIHLAILNVIDKSGYRNGAAAASAYSAAKMVVNRVSERKKAK